MNKHLSTIYNEIVFIINEHEYTVRRKEITDYLAEKINLDFSSHTSSYDAITRYLTCLRKNGYLKLARHDAGTYIIIDKIPKDFLFSEIKRIKSRCPEREYIDNFPIKLCKNTYYAIKINGKWLSLAKYLWEKKYGKVDAGHIIRYMDKNSQNCRIENLYKERLGRKK